MSVIEIVWFVVAAPFDVLYEFMFQNLSWRIMSRYNEGWALIAMGVLVNLLALPLYTEMERLGRRERLAREAMHAELRRIKSHYEGRERYFYIRTTHRIFGYHPLKAIFSSSDLVLQIVIFSTAYHYLNGLPALDTPFFAITNLNAPDQLLHGFNALPVVMTIANIGSVLVYTQTRKQRLQGLGLAVFFLALLYEAPAGLVLYWTTSNIFSLVRNIIGKQLVTRIPDRLRHAGRRLIDTN